MAKENPVQADVELTAEQKRLAFDAALQLASVCPAKDGLCMYAAEAVKALKLIEQHGERGLRSMKHDWLALVAPNEKVAKAMQQEPTLEQRYQAALNELEGRRIKPDVLSRAQLMWPRTSFLYRDLKAQARRTVRDVHSAMREVLPPEVSQRLQKELIR